MVLIEHWGPTLAEEGPVARFVHSFFVPSGSFGVELFFVLSGFLITSILLNARASEQKEERLTTVKNFFFRRALRIFPVYYFVVLVVYIFNVGDVRANIGYLVSYTLNMYCYAQNRWPSMGHLWSLAVEEQYYLLWPWLIIFIRERYLKYVFIIAIATGVISTYICMARLGHIDPFLVINCFDAFGIGGAYAYAASHISLRRKFEKGVFYAALFALAIYFYWKTLTYIGQPIDHSITFGKTVDSIIALWLIIMVVNCRPGRVKKYFLENRVLNFIGKISYGLYLYHMPFIHIASQGINDWLAQLAKHNPTSIIAFNSPGFSYFVHASLLVIVVTISFYVIEKPFLRLKKFFEYRRPSSPVAEHAGVKRQ